MTEFNGEWLAIDQQKYKDACIRLSKNLDNFKTDGDYRRWVGNDCRGADVVESFDKAVDLPYVSKNDEIGGPILHHGKSAATLRFMKVADDLSPPVNSIIVEIGGGYGGQCLVMKTLHNVGYTIIDIPEALELSRAYLAANNIKCGFISTENVPKLSCDILISDYCLSELDEEGIDFYLDQIDAQLIHLTCLDKIVYIKKALEKRGYSVTETDEHPKTSNHGNKILRGVKRGG